MRPCILLLTLLVVLAGCKPEDTPAALRLVRTLVVDTKRINEDRQAIGEVKPRYESDLSFRVAGKVLSRLVDVGAWVKQGDTLAALDTQDYRNRLRSAEADVSASEAALALLKLGHVMDNRADSIAYDVSGAASVDLPFLHDLPFHQTGSFSLKGMQ